jgi:hypothetical protein
LAVEHDVLEGGGGFGRIRAHEDAFSGGQAAGLDDQRATLLFDVVAGVFVVGEGLVICRWDVVFGHECFGEGFGGF